MKIHNPLRLLSWKELLFWLFSLSLITASFLIASNDYLTLISSLIGVTALVFVTKGLVVGQFICVVFALFYGVVSFFFGYYGEMITYLFMSGPIAICAIVSWIRHPFRDSAEVEVHRITKKEFLLLLGLTAVVTTVFHFILRALGNTNLPLSTVSVATSFIAASLLKMRSPFYAVAYAVNDVVLIGLWIYASLADPSYLPMVICFSLFLVYDLYGFCNWRKMQRRQQEA